MNREQARETAENYISVTLTPIDMTDGVLQWLLDREKELTEENEQYKISIDLMQPMIAQLEKEKATGAEFARQWIDKYHSSTNELDALQQSFANSEMPEKNECITGVKHQPNKEQVELQKEDRLDYSRKCPDIRRLPIQEYDFNRGWEYGFGSAIDQARLVEKRLLGEIAEWKDKYNRYLESPRNYQLEEENKHLKSLLDGDRLRKIIMPIEWEQRQKRNSYEYTVTKLIKAIKGEKGGIK